MNRLHVGLGEKSYDILIGRGLCDTLDQEIRNIYGGEKIFILTDDNVGSLYGERIESLLFGAGFSVRRLALPPGEPTKSLSSLARVYEALLDFRLSRGELILTLGGGVIGDLGGFAASTYLRGVPFVQVPTSLVAQTDSSIGGKTGVNLDRGKNLVGSFYQPIGVFIDPTLLETLPDKEFSDGMAEVIKTGCIKDAGLFSKLFALRGRQDFMDRSEEIIGGCCRVKKQLVESDERDTGSRMLLNFGHTLGHAIEKYYSYRTYSHGEAVAAGMHMITLLGEERGLTQKGTADQIKALTGRFGLPDKIIPEDADILLGAVSHDKKSFGRTLKVVLLKHIGESFLYETSPDFFKGACLWQASSSSPQG